MLCSGSGGIIWSFIENVQVQVDNLSKTTNQKP